MQFSSEDAALLSFIAKCISINKPEMVRKYLDTLEGDAYTVASDMLGEAKLPCSVAYLTWARNSKLDEKWRRN